MKKILKIFVSVFIVILGLILFAACGNTSKEVPTYEGMTLSKGTRNLSMNSSFRKGNIISSEEDNNFYEDVFGDDSLKKEVDDVVSLEVKGDSTVKYYVTTKEKVIVEIHLSNPSSFEIQSFTLNGEKYANYMFKDGSTLELLLLEINAPSETGYHDLTIDAIKYIDGTEIKDVRMNGDKSIKMGVQHTILPTINNVKETIGTTKMELSFTAEDKKNIIGENPFELYLSDGENVVSKKTVELGENKVTFDNLVMGKTYQYGIVAVYDEVDGKQLQEHWLVKNKFTTKKAYYFTNAVATQDKITFEYASVSNEGGIDSIELIDATTDKVIISTKTNEFINLLSNHEYYVKLSFHYDINGKETKDYSMI